MKPSTSQNLVIANSGIVGNGPATIFGGGDTYINDYTFHTYGWIDAHNDSYTGVNDPTRTTWVACRFSCEAAANIGLRFPRLATSTQTIILPARW